MHGFGIYVGPGVDGERYEGQFNFGVRQGRGIASYGHNEGGRFTDPLGFSCVSQKMIACHECVCIDQVYRMVALEGQFMTATGKVDFLMELARSSLPMDVHTRERYVTLSSSAWKNIQPLTSCSSFGGSVVV